MSQRHLSILLLFSLGCSGQSKPYPVVPPAAVTPTIETRPEAVAVANLTLGDLNRLYDARLPAEDWAAILGVYVAGDPEDARPAVAGDYLVENDKLTFHPRFALEPGIRYRIALDVSRIPGHEGKAERVEAEFYQPKQAIAPTTVVDQVYPTRDELPENQLKFYLHFSAPMARGDAYRHIQLLDAAGKPIDMPFYELDEELWDPSQRRFTLFFDPGRIKRGLKPREEVGPALEEGKSYTLVINRAWADAQGCPLKESYRKAFKVGKPDDAIIDIKKWKVAPPAAGTGAPLVVTFPKPLDHALLHRMLWVVDAADRPVPGNIRVTERETVWEFHPESPWQPGPYALVADTALEDLAGNTIARPFEVDAVRPIEKDDLPKTVKLPFEIRAE